MKLLRELIRELEPPDPEREPLEHSDWLTLRELIKAHDAGKGDFAWEIAQMAGVLGLPQD